MRYHLFVSLIATIVGLPAAISASPLVKRHDSCPSGYTMSVYYETVAITSATTPTPVPEQTAITSITSTYVETPTAISDAAVSTAPTEISSAAPAPKTTDVKNQQHVAAPTSTSEVSQELTTTTAVVPVESSTSSSSTSSPAKATSSSSSASSSVSTSSAETAGTATNYGGNLSGGACSFSDYTLPSGLFGTALSIDQWDTSANCGACVAVKGPSGNTIKAMIVDECPSCEANHFDLFENAFGELAAISTGVIDIDWEFTPCDLTGPLKLRNKSGTSQYWFSMQVVNANEPVTALEASTDGGDTWQSTTRTSYNYFEYSSGFGTDTVDVRVTGKSGSTVVVKNVSASSTSDITASSNL